MSICVVGLVCAVKEPCWPGSHRPPSTQGHHLPDRAGLGEEGRVLQVGPGPRYVPVIHNQSPPDLSRASSGQDELAERSHAGYIHVSLRNTCHQALRLSTQEQETLLIQQRDKCRNSERTPCEWWKWWENGNHDLFILMKNAYCQSHTKKYSWFW